MNLLTVGALFLLLILYKSNVNRLDNQDNNNAYIADKYDVVNYG